MERSPDAVRRRGLGRVALLVVLVTWCAAAMYVAGLELARAGRDEAIMLAVERHLTGAAGSTTHVLDSNLWFTFARMGLVLGLVAIVIGWLATFAGRSFRSRRSAGVVILFAVAFVATYVAAAPISGGWWAPANGQNVGSLVALHHFYTEDRQAAAGFQAAAGLAALGLAAIAFVRPARSVRRISYPPVQAG